MNSITEQVNVLADFIHSARAGRPRLVVALAGAPGSGKSTLASELSRRLTAQKCQSCVVPLDGFHLDNVVLETMGALGRKGAPDTFDSAGFLHLVRRLKTPADVVYPIFDRARDLSIAGAGLVPSDCPVVLVEGNYLLFDQAPWSDLADLWDISVQLSVPLPELRARLIQRWLDHGLSRMAATNRAERNDLANANLVISQSLPADINL